MLRLGIEFGTNNSSVVFYNGNEFVPVKGPNTLNYLVPCMEEECDLSIPIQTASGFSSVIYYRLARTAFNTMIASMINETISCCRKMIQRTRLSSKQISRILLVGGSCRIPYVKERLKQEFQYPIEAEDLELVVCKGAALYKVEDPPSTTAKPPFSSSPPGESKSLSSKKKDRRGKVAILSSSNHG